MSIYRALYDCIAGLFSIYNFFLFLIFGQRYIHVIDVCSRYFVTIGTLLRSIENLDRRSNETLTRLTRAEEHIDRLLEHVGNLLGEQEELEVRLRILENPGTPEDHQDNDRGSPPWQGQGQRTPSTEPASPYVSSPRSTPSPSPPPPQSSPFGCSVGHTTSNLKRASVLFLREDEEHLPRRRNFRNLPTYESQKSVSMPCLNRIVAINGLRKPSSAELLSRKSQLKLTDVERSPGGTPLFSGLMFRSEHDHLDRRDFLRLALEKRFGAMRPLSPISQISSHNFDSEDLSSSELSLTVH